MFSIGSFSATLGIDTGGYTRGILSAQGLTQAFGTTFSSFIANPVAGSIALFANLGRSITSASDKMLSMAKATLLLSNRTGVSTDTIQALRLKLEEAGVGADAANQSLSFFTKTLGEARSGSKAQADAFEALGLSAKSFTSAEDAFVKVLDVIAAIEDPALRAARAAEMFGRFGGAEMVAALDGGSAALAAYAQKMADVGSLIDNKTLVSLVRLEEQIEGIKRIGAGVGTTALSQFLAGLSGDADVANGSIRDIAKTINDEVGPSMKRLGETIRESLPEMKELATTVTEIVDGLGILFDGGSKVDGPGWWERQRQAQADRYVKSGGLLFGPGVEEQIAQQRAQGERERARARR